MERVLPAPRFVGEGVIGTRTSCAAARSRDDERAMLRFLGPWFVAAVGFAGSFAACGESLESAPADATEDAKAPPVEGGRSPTAADAADDAASGGPQVLFPRTGIHKDELAVLVNDGDPLSVMIADYYVTARKIPAANVVHLNFPSAPAKLSEADFAPLKAKVDAALEKTDAQALLLTWTKPYAVENMSITSAFAMDYKPIANGNTCNDPNSGAANPYGKKPGSTKPFTDVGFRPAMVLPATTMEEAQALIDRGIASDGTLAATSKGSAYFMRTSDHTRSARCIVNPTFGYTNQCQQLIDLWDTTGTNIEATIVEADSIKGKTDVLFYVQGLASVPDLKANTYLPGAIADHLTSFGGQIPTSSQMSAFEFLRAGATGSYGTVVEPCAFIQKFPNPLIFVPRYFGGATLIEAYWKSVKWPAEGIFLGEPLARPFGPGFRSTFKNGTLTIETTAMEPNVAYLVEAADSEAGPFTPVQDNLTNAKITRQKIEIPKATRAVYRFRAK